MTSLIEKALQISKTEHGPIHINVPFAEPLYDTVEEFTSDPNPAKIKINNPSYFLCQKQILKSGILPSEK